jgi:CheY-like chemotaxis protein
MARKTLLLIDDDFDDRDTFLLSIKEVDPLIHCVTAKDGREAIEMLQNDESFIPDFIFLDLNMPRMGGKEFLVAVRKFERMKNVLIYIYTTSAANKDKEEALALSAAGFITKPYTINKLKEILSELLASD